ncbi:MAG: dephospho-CoA kinase [Thiohalomonadales bacterium]
MLTIGLTGGIACGKTMVSQYFGQLGIPIIDTDIIAKQLVEPNQPALAEIIERFGAEIIDNNKLKRKQLSEIIFKSPHKKQQLEAILHPKIESTVLDKLSTIELNNARNIDKVPYRIVVIPLLFETKSKYPIDRILLVDCTVQQQIERAMSRDNITRKKILAIIKNQISRTERLKKADDVIENKIDQDSCFSKIRQIHNKYLKLGKI